MSEESELPEAIAKLAASELTALADEMESQLGRAPTSAELVDVLAWGLKSLPEGTVDGFDATRLTGLRAQYRRGAKPSGDAAKNEVDELNDAPFTMASDLAALLTDRLADELGDKPTLDDLLGAILAGLHRAGESILSDVDPRDVIAIKAELRRGKQPRPKVGDVVAIPASNGEHHLAVVVAKNGFGTAYGVLEGTGPARPLSKSSRREVWPHPFYSDDDPVVSGRWLLVDHDEELLDAFPSEPEIFHLPRPDMPYVDVGPHGAAERPGGKLRKLSEQEAKEAGMDREDFHQTFLADDLERYLDARLEQS